MSFQIAATAFIVFVCSIAALVSAGNCFAGLHRFWAIIIVWSCMLSFAVCIVSSLFYIWSDAILPFLIHI